MIKFLSNHTPDEVELLLGERVRVIAHPYVQPRWTIADIRRECADTLRDAVSEAKLILNGDYTLVALIVLDRAALGLPTGFICFDKIAPSEADKQADGTIKHVNVLRAVAIRWINPEY